MKEVDCHSNDIRDMINTDFPDADIKNNDINSDGV